MPRRLVLLLALLAALAAGIWWLRSGRAPAEAPATPAASPATRPVVQPPPALPPVPPPSPATSRGAAAEPPPPPPPNVPDPRQSPADFPIAAALNAPESDVARDLDVLRQLFEAWLSNFPHDGNPVGENADITAALMGANSLGLALVPRGHRAVNAQGELCDRWGTPFRFHQLSGKRMEVRSAGPDRRFGTADDAMLTPP